MTIKKAMEDEISDGLFVEKGMSELKKNKPHFSLKSHKSNDDGS